MKESSIQQLAASLKREHCHQVVILTDSNVDSLYPDYFSSLESLGIEVLDKIVVAAGEESKNLNQVEEICARLLELGCDKSVCLLNFGGGMVSDLGGLSAAVFKRGVRYVNCPTTLISMVDAAIGGKTGVNLLHTKNVIGLICQPFMVMEPDADLLNTLPYQDLLSGFGEMIKYALIGVPTLFDELCSLESLGASSIKKSWIEVCAEFKRSVVSVDPNDTAYRHILNFGHTVGHAIEGARAIIGQPVPHGVAVAEGMLYEALLSRVFGSLSEVSLRRIQRLVLQHFEVKPMSDDMVDLVLELMERDKKNRDGDINFTMLKDIGVAQPDCCLDVQTCRRFFELAFREGFKS
ncbi:MAG: 3-dehydroquinate synthase [Bacteroidales bacterium]|nr:3-dehydroquinate synthase [Bacteroidales bacterium]